MKHLNQGPMTHEDDFQDYRSELTYDITRLDVSFGKS